MKKSFYLTIVAALFLGFNAKSQDTIRNKKGGGCNRLRLTADGKMKNCLFSKGEIDLLTPYRNGGDIEELIFKSLKDKKEQTGGQDFSVPTENRSMIAIGG